MATIRTNPYSSSISSDKLTASQAVFFRQLENYVDETLYFYGSIQRADYIPGKSDIDVCLFSENEHSTLAKLLHFLHLPRSKVKKIVWRINNIRKPKIVYGYKVQFSNREEGGDIEAEFSVYNSRFKEKVMEDHLMKMHLPVYCSVLLYIIKVLYYQLLWIDKDTYRYLKRKVMSRWMGLEEDQFLVLS
jgi:hypothetical protein